MLSLGDMKPLSLRQLETLIWTNLFLVSRREISASEMISRVLDTIIDGETISSFHGDANALRDYFRRKYDPVEDHISFFHPGLDFSFFTLTCAIFTGCYWQMWLLL